MPNNDKNTMSFDEWLQYGVDRHWSSAPICRTHDGDVLLSETNECEHYIALYKNKDDANKKMSRFSVLGWRLNVRPNLIIPNDY